MVTIELRCDTNPARMFAKLLVEGEPVVSENLFEFKCRDCAKLYEVDTVLHRFSISGQLVETEVVGED